MQLMGKSERQANDEEERERQTGDREEREARARVCVCVYVCVCMSVYVYVYGCAYVITLASEFSWTCRETPSAHLSQITRPCTILESSICLFNSGGEASDRKKEDKMGSASDKN